MATIHTDEKRLLIETNRYVAAIRTEGYVSGVAEGSFVDRKTGAHDPGFGLLIADFLLAPGADTAEAPPGGRYQYNEGDAYHGNIAKRYIALPQICTQAKSLPHEIVEGRGFVAVRQWHTWDVACPPYKAGSKWEQHLLFPDNRRWFLSWDRFACAEDVPAVMMRLDMPGHIRHNGGDVFRQVYLSYPAQPGVAGRANDHTLIPESAFHQNFPPDARYLYRRDDSRLPHRLIRAMQLQNGVWLAGMTLDPAAVYEAWCHQRDYVCMIAEIGGRAARAGEWTGAVHLVGYFDSIPEMEHTYDSLRGAHGLQYDTKSWRILK